MRIIYTNTKRNFVPNSKKLSKAAKAEQRAAKVARRAHVAKVDLNSPAQVAAREAFLGSLRKA